MNKTVIALLLGALGTLFFTLVYASGKLAGGNISAFQIMFVRYVSGLLILICIVAAGKSHLVAIKVNDLTSIYTGHSAERWALSA